MESGLRSGIRDGIGSAFGLSPMRNALKNGFQQKNLPKKDKFQDFTILRGVKALDGCAWLADYGVYNASNNLSAMANQLDTSQTFALNGDPNFNLAVFGAKKSIQFDANDRIYTTSSTFLQGYTQQTVMMVVKLSGAGYLYNYVDSTFASSTGDLLIEAINSTTVRSSFYGSPASSSVSQITTYDDLGGNWFLITVICDINEQTGVGQEMYINGKLITNYTTNTFTPSTGTFFGINGSFGNNSSLTSGGNNYMAGALVLPYAVNSSERIRLENFFRIYYGYQF